MVQNREDCVGVSSHRPNWAASHVHALMLHEGSVRTPGGHFFTFADAGALSHDQAGHLRLRQLASPVRISVSPPINFHYCFQPPPELVWVRTVQPMRSHMCGACSMVQMTAIPGTTGTPRLLQPVRLPISATPCSILCMFPLSDFICTAGLGIARPENEGVRAAVGRWGPACTMRRTTVHTTDAPCDPSLLSVNIARRSPDARL